MFISFLKKNENTRNTLFSILREREVHMNTLEESFIVRSTILCSIMSPAKVLDHSRKASDDDECDQAPFFFVCVCVLQIKKKGS